MVYVYAFISSFTNEILKGLLFIYHSEKIDPQAS